MKPPSNSLPLQVHIDDEELLAAAAAAAAAVVGGHHGHGHAAGGVGLNETPLSRAMANGDFDLAERLIEQSRAAEDLVSFIFFISKVQEQISKLFSPFSSFLVCVEKSRMSFTHHSVLN